MFLSVRTAQLVSAVMILVLTSSELTRYACGQWAYAISMEHEAEESSETESKMEVADQADEVIFTSITTEYNQYAFQQTYTLCYSFQKPAFGLCKVQLEPPDYKLVS